MTGSRLEGLSGGVFVSAAAALKGEWQTVEQIAQTVGIGGEQGQGKLLAALIRLHQRGIAEHSALTGAGRYWRRSERHDAWRATLGGRFR